MINMLRARNLDVCPVGTFSFIVVDPNFSLGCYDCSVHVWSLKDGKKILSAVRHVEPIKSVYWYNHGNQSERCNIIF